MEEEIIKLYQSGISMRKIEKLCNHSKNTISKILKKNNIHIRYQNETSRIYKCDESFFENIDSEIKAYWLGFLMADGFIESKRQNGAQKFGVTLNIKDKEHIVKFNNHLKSTYEIKVYKGSGYNPNGLFAKLLITSQKMVNDLKRHGMVENKTKIAKFPTTIPQQYIKDFIRGYFDGDGSIYFDNHAKRYRISILGTKDFLEGIVKAFDIQNNIYVEKEDIYVLNCTTSKDINTVLYKMYNNSTIFLDRKYNRYLDSLQYIEK